MPGAVPSPSPGILWSILPRQLKGSFNLNLVTPVPFVQLTSGFSHCTRRSSPSDFSLCHPAPCSLCSHHTGLSIYSVRYKPTLATVCSPRSPHHSPSGLNSNPLPPVPSCSGVLSPSCSVLSFCLFPWYH